MTRPRRPPPPAALAAFGVEGPAVALDGGRGTAWRVGGAVLKPVDMDPLQLQWQGELLTGLDGREDFRVSVPLRTTSGEWASDGWTASCYQPGCHRPGRWLDIIAVGRCFHAALEGVPEPPFLAARTDAWAIGDKVAWRDLPWRDLPWADRGPTRSVARLLAALRPIAVRRQLVHGDLTGNVLFDDDLPPLVIDLSPYWRPTGFASAVVIADALVFEGADEAAFEPVLQQPETPQHLLRALVYRAVTDQVAQPGRHPDADDVYTAAVDLALRWANHRL